MEVRFTCECLLHCGGGGGGGGIGLLVTKMRHQWRRGHLLTGEGGAY